jgi:hypothetical protein
MGFSDPLLKFIINETLKGTSLDETASFEPSYVLFRCAVRPIRES